MSELTLEDGGTLSYETRGQGPPLLLVPGLGGEMSFFDAVAPVLARSFTLILHDHRGCGRSDRSRIDFSVEQMAGDVLALLDHLGIGRAHYLGHSTGGAIGQTLALDAPERVDRLVLSATWPRADGYFRTLFDVRSEILRELGPRAYLRATTLVLQPSFRLRDQPELAAITDAEAKARIPDPEVVLRRIQAILRFDRADELHRITAPTLVICARDDVVTPAYFSEALGRLVPGATTVILADGGHMLPGVHPERFARHVVDFLNPRA